MTTAKELFFRYDGSHFAMAHEGDYDEYQSYNIPKSTEDEWRKELLDDITRKIFSSNDGYEVSYGIMRFKLVISEGSGKQSLAKHVDVVLHNHKNNDTFSNLLITETTKRLLDSIGGLHTAYTKLATNYLTLATHLASSEIMISDKHPGLIGDCPPEEQIRKRIEAVVIPAQQLCAKFPYLSIHSE